MKFKPIPPEFLKVIWGRYKDEEGKELLETLTKAGFYAIEGEEIKLTMPRMAVTILGKKYEALFDKVPNEYRPGFEFILTFVYATKYSAPAPSKGMAKRAYDLGREFLKNKKVPEWLMPLNNE